MKPIAFNYENFSALQEENLYLAKSVAELARESVEREKALARLEAEVMVWAKAEQEGRLVVLPCKVKENCFVVSHTDKTITEITVSEFSYSIWHDAWVVAAANGHQFFLDNAYRTRAEAEEALLNSNLWICHECHEKLEKAIREAPNE